MAQTYLPVEIIVIDDVFSEPVMPVLQSRFGLRISCFRNSVNLGVQAGRNIGIRKSKGDWSASLDDDDRWRPLKLERQSNALRNKSFRPSPVNCWADLVQRGRSAKIVKFAYRDGDISSLLETNSVGSTSVVIAHKECFVSAGLFDEELKSCQDWDMWLGIAQEFPIVSVQEVLAEQNVYGRQIPTNLPLQIQGMERFLLKHPALLKEYHRVRSFLLRQMGLHYYVANRGRVAQYGVLV